MTKTSKYFIESLTLLNVAVESVGCVDLPMPPGTNVMDLPAAFNSIADLSSRLLTVATIEKLSKDDEYF